MLNKNKKLLILIYGDPGYYPPTLNAINELASIYSEITLIYRPFLKSNFNFPKNVKLKPVGQYCSIEDEISRPFPLKVWSQLKFIVSVISTVLFKHFNTILVYDFLATLSLFLAFPVINRNTFIWYHNHDVPNVTTENKLSLGYLCLKTQEKILKRAKIFSLPSKERLIHFPTHQNTNIFIIPNYPSVKRYNFNINNIEKLAQPTLLYQGTISEGHGLKNIIQTINHSNKLSHFNLKLIGKVNAAFEKELVDEDTLNKVEMVGFVEYNFLPKLSATCHIGIAVNEPKEIIYQTGGSASNKIYEYAACGLPIIYFDHAHYNTYLEKYNWAFKTDLSTESLEQCIQQIMDNYKEYAFQAKSDFEEKLNFEVAFKPLLNFLNDKLI